MPEAEIPSPVRRFRRKNTPTGEGKTSPHEGDVPWLSEALALVERATTTSEPAEDDDD